MYMDDVGLPVRMNTLALEFQQASLGCCSDGVHIHHAWPDAAPVEDGG